MFILVDQGAPKSAYNQDSSWILICFVSPTDRSLAWLPGRINIPSNSISEFDNQTGTASWLTNNGVSHLAIEDTTVGTKQISISYDDTNKKISFDATPLITTLTSYSSTLTEVSRKLSIEDATVGTKQITLSYDDTNKKISFNSTPLRTTLADLSKALSISDTTVGTKQITISYDAVNRRITFNSTTLVNTLTVHSARFRQVGACINFSLAIMSQWGNQSLAATNVVRNGNGIIDIKFTTALGNANYGIQLTMQSNNPGFIQYANVTTTGLSVLTYNVAGALTTFTGDFTLEIQT